jgi:hypothetical protein
VPHSSTSSTAVSTSPREQWVLRYALGGAISLFCAEGVSTLLVLSLFRALPLPILTVLNGGVQGVILGYCLSVLTPPAMRQAIANFARWRLVNLLAFLLAGVLYGIIGLVFNITTAGWQARLVVEVLTGVVGGGLIGMLQARELWQVSHKRRVWTYQHALASTLSLALIWLSIVGLYALVSWLDSNGRIATILYPFVWMLAGGVYGAILSTAFWRLQDE